MSAVGSSPLEVLDALPLDHLIAMTDRRGLFEHAEHSEPRRDHGYCLDDVARALVVAVRDTESADASPLAAGLVNTYLSFTEAAIQRDGRAHNRMNVRGRWTDRPGVGDWWGRAILALGFVAARSSSAPTRARALVAFERAARQRSPHLRAMASATIGAADVLSAAPDSPSAMRLLLEGVAFIPAAADAQTPSAKWPWPEPRLRYGNAAIPEALLVAGAVLDIPLLTERGLTSLDFLVDMETRGGHLSVTGTAGRGPDELGVQFDQQPIEVAVLADASARALELGHGQRWADTVDLAWAWFLGENDVGVVMLDPDTGAGFDGLHSFGRNENRGAESTLAAVSTFQQMRAQQLNRLSDPAQS